MTPSFSSTFWALTVCDINFYIGKKNVKIRFHGVWSFWSVKYLNFGCQSCEIRCVNICKLKKICKKKEIILSSFYTRWINMKFLESGLHVKHFKSGALRAIRNIAEKEYNFCDNLKKRIPSQVYLFADTEQHSEMWISLLVFFQDFVDRFGTTYLKNRFHCRYFSE